MPNFPPTVDELIEEFSELEDWDERYDLIIDFGLDELTIRPDPADARRVCTAYVLRLLSLVGLEPALGRCATCGVRQPPCSDWCLKVVDFWMSEQPPGSF